MNNFNLFGIGPMELIFVLIIALVVLGPERLPQVAHEMTKLVRQVREIYTEIMGTLQKEFGEMQELKELQELSNSLRDPLNLKEIGKPLPKTTAKTKSGAAAGASTTATALSAKESKPLAPKPPPAAQTPDSQTPAGQTDAPSQNGSALVDEHRIAPPSLAADDAAGETSDSAPAPLPPRETPAEEIP